jgi:hypothetical protein
MYYGIHTFTRRYVYTYIIVALDFVVLQNCPSRQGGVAFEIRIVLYIECCHAAQSSERGRWEAIGEFVIIEVPAMHRCVCVCFHVKTVKLVGGRQLTNLLSSRYLRYTDVCVCVFVCFHVRAVRQEGGL